MSAPACEIRTIDCTALLEKGGQLFEAHWDEIALNKHLMVFKPDTERYHAMEQAGVLFALAAHIDGELIGYSVSFVTRHLHYADLLFAQNDVLFLDKRYRASGAGLALIRATEEEAKARGARMIIWHAKQGTALEAVLPRIGYGVQDVMFSKEI